MQIYIGLSVLPPPVLNCVKPSKIHKRLSVRVETEKHLFTNAEAFKCKRALVEVNSNVCRQNWLSMEVLILLAPCDFILVWSAVPLAVMVLAPRDSHESDSHSVVSSISLLPLL